MSHHQATVDLLSSYGAGRFVIVRTTDSSDATVRLQSDMVLNELASVSPLSASLHTAGTPIDSGSGPAFLVFHYNDLPAVAEVRRLATAGNTIPVCFGADLYSFERYLDVHDVAAFYVMPTAEHRAVLAGQVYRPVYHLDEPVDPIAIGAGPAGAPAGARAERASKRLLWFGYAESFSKSMASLVPVIQDAMRQGAIDDFCLLLDEHRFSNRLGLRTMGFEPDTFLDVAQSFDYCILSHLPLDLGLNSLIKSPNKAVTAIIAGLVPIASRTPSYERLMTGVGLDRFLFTSPPELKVILDRLDPVADRKSMIDARAANVLMSERNGSAVARAFLALCADYLASGQHGRIVPAPPNFSQIQPRVGLREHLTDLVPSLVRAIRLRMVNVRT